MQNVLNKPSSSQSLETALTDSLTPKAAVSYLRVSTHRQAERGGGNDEGFSIPAQREANKKKAASMGAIIIKEFVDRGESARSADRPALQQMLEYINENKNRIDYVIVHKVDRLARNRGDDVDITRALHNAGVKLVSTTESIDETPSGILLHGIMSSIAEFYSRNLSNEVIKGLSQKAKDGGTNYRAPLGYKNIRTVDNQGRENRTVILDEERAPLIRLAFKYYATGDWTIKDLANYLALRGLTTAKTPKVPSKPVNRSILNNVLTNPYYKGMVSFEGALYPGKQIPLTDEQTWQQVQDVLASHVNGERTREHPHYLKSTVYCGSCGSRLLVHMAKSHTGAVYPYFVCAGRHGKYTHCQQKAVLINEVEEKIEELYDRMSIAPELRQKLEQWLDNSLKESADKFNTEKGSLEREKEKLERQRLKLLQAYDAEAIPLDLLKTEEGKISRALAEIADQISAHETKYEVLQTNLSKSFDMIENCGLAYKQAPDTIKRAFNQAIFEKILVYSDGHIEPEFKPPFNILLDFADSKIIHSVLAKTTEVSDKEKNPAQIFFGQGLTTDILVDLNGIEPSTSRMRTERSPS